MALSFGVEPVVDVSSISLCFQTNDLVIEKKSYGLLETDAVSVAAGRLSQLASISAAPAAAIDKHLGPISFLQSSI